MVLWLHPPPQISSSPCMLQSSLTMSMSFLANLLNFKWPLHHRSEKYETTLVHSYLLKAFQWYKECTPKFPKKFIIIIIILKIKSWKYLKFNNSCISSLNITESSWCTSLLVKSFLAGSQLSKTKHNEQNAFLNNMISQGIIFCLVANVISIPTSEKLHFLAQLFNLCSSRFWLFNVRGPKCQLSWRTNFALSPLLEVLQVLKLLIRP
jgi:hypothetical protein